MNRDDFEQAVKEGKKTEYVNRSIREYMRDNFEFRVIDKSALEKSEYDQTECVSVSLPTDASTVSDSELIKRVKGALGDSSRDIQFLQVEHNGKAPTVIEIWRHGSGYSAFALSE